jgi:hypothetical protein
MSGYLRRLVDTAAARGESVHPTTGSIFSPHQPEIDAPLQNAEEAESVTSSPIARAPATPPRRGESRGDAPRSLHAPLLPRAPASVDFSSAEIAEPARRGSRTEPVLDLDEPSLPPERARREAESDTDIDATNGARPIRDEADQTSRSFMKPATPFDAVTRPVWLQPKPQERAVAQGAREPDEIQIHIGRIEVIAMQPPAPPRPSKAPAQSLTLDAFLNRRDGKSR